ncbi:unnamed protein product [Nippostrongylus brasiliensis]|uniref:Uncharacterized protein n=1 Tax=Nippostrongylus brasiliensis TaxID=27835 RepID=A0A0N4YFN8_NIPBR|nr:hypothetical protein Q1695_016156 [Nippostrongylus brasiliensis]VDL79175.1 unnamed protein product [Nippostrongylus brasiliensis]
MRTFTFLLLIDLIILVTAITRNYLPPYYGPLEKFVDKNTGAVDGRKARMQFDSTRNVGNEKHVRRSHAAKAR